MKLISLNDLKKYLELGSSSVNYDTMLDLMINGISSRMQTYCNRLFKELERTELFDGGGKYFYVKASPIDLSATIEVQINNIIKTKNSDYYIYDNEGLIMFNRETSDSAPQNISVKYTGGYEEVDGVLSVPDDFKRACFLQCTFEFKRRNDIGLNSMSMKSGTVNLKYTGELLPEVKSTLTSHRKHPG